MSSQGTLEVAQQGELKHHPARNRQHRVALVTYILSAHLQRCVELSHDKSPNKNVNVPNECSQHKHIFSILASYTVHGLESGDMGFHIPSIENY